MALAVNQGETEYTPEQAGYIASKLSEIDNHLIRLIQNKTIVAGGYILSKDDKTFAHRSMGKLRYDSEDNTFKPDSIRRIASLTKLFTAVSIMQLIEQGHLYLKQPIKTIIKEFDKKTLRDITIFHLLTHTAGIFPTPGSINEPYPVRLTIFEQAGWIKEALRGNLYAEPGTVWAYSSFGYMLLAEIVEHITGQKFEDYVTQQIFEPLGMGTTFFRIPEKLAYRVSISDKHSESVFRANSEQTQGTPKGNTGIYSTLEDMRKFGQCFLNKGMYNGTRILSRKSVEEMTRNHLTNIRSYSWNDNGKLMNYGLGFHLYGGESLATPGTFGHEGAGLTGLFVDPVENFVLVYFCPLPVPIWIPEPVINLRNLVWSGIE